MATPVSAQMSNHRRPSASGATVSSSSSESRSESRHSRPESAHRPTEARSAQSMNSGRTRPDHESMTSRHQATAPKDNSTRPSGGGNHNGNSGNGGNYGNGGNHGNHNGNSGNYGNDRDRNNGGNRNGGNSYGNDSRRPNGGGNYNGNGGNHRPSDNGNYGHNDRDRNRGGGNYGHNDRDRDRDRGGYNYGHNDRDRNRGHNAYRDHYSWNYHHNNWSRPLPPPARMHRPAPYRHHRPHIPAGWRPYYGAPLIDRILGITFGTLFDASLNYLYTNGYNIDGYDNGVVYLRNVNMLNLPWADVMLCYDDYGRLYNAQFIHSSYYNDRSRYNRLYNDLCAVYGSPIDYDGDGVTWFGGNSTGYVTLSMNCTGSRYYTNLYIGN